MNIIEHLEQTVSSLVLADTVDTAKLSLLEQFYAILATRLSATQLYSHIQSSTQARSDSVDAIHNSLFEQLWQEFDDRQTIIRELSAAHHINEIVTAQLLVNATPLAYQALMDCAKGEYLPEFLQHQQPNLRHYLPAWSASVITENTQINDLSTSDVVVDPNEMTASEADISNIKIFDEEVIELGELPDTDAIHANPSEHHVDNNDIKPFRVARARNHIKGIRKVSWLLFALAILAGMGLALVMKPMPVVETTAAVPTVAAPLESPLIKPLTPVSMSIGVDNNGNLYTCSAKVGDDSLQDMFMQALNVSFGEQAGICEVIIDKKIAVSLSNMSVETLTDILTLLRATPFARLQLQNERMVLEAPDSMLLQQLVDNMRILVPAMPIQSAAPIPLPDNLNTNNLNNENLNTDNDTPMNNPIDSSNEDTGDLNSNNLSDANTDINNDQAADDETGDSLMSDTSSQDRNNNANIYVRPVPSGPISLSELEEMASKEIRVDPVRSNQ